MDWNILKSSSCAFLVLSATSFFPSVESLFKSTHTPVTHCAARMITHPSYRLDAYPDARSFTFTRNGYMANDLPRHQPIRRHLRLLHFDSSCSLGYRLLVCLSCPSAAALPFVIASFLTGLALLDPPPQYPLSNFLANSTSRHQAWQAARTSVAAPS